MKSEIAANTAITGEKLIEIHRPLKVAVFHIKSFLLTLKRQLENTRSGLKKFQDNGLLTGQAVVSISESNLWNKDDNELNWLLTAGKVQNLRIAAQQLNGIEIPANCIFSFWKQLGRPSSRKGYKTGREIKEGCVVPTIAGGLCQLSNALYDAAMQAGFEIIERHKHTKIIKGSLAEQDKDATVKWSHVDLRFRSVNSFRIEVELSEEKLIVKFKSVEKIIASATGGLKNTIPFSKINDCYSCNNLSCFKHHDKSPVKKENSITAFILDEKWNEYDEYIKTIATDKDVLIMPVLKSKIVKTNRYSWTTGNIKNIKTIPFVTFQRAFQLRLFARAKKNIFSAKLLLDKKMAEAAAKLIPLECTHIIISQNLLPFMMEKGILGGRTFDVLMTGLPIDKIHQQLDLAHSNYPESKTLTDFRASQGLIDLENNALKRSRYIITPHREIADLFKNKSIQLKWTIQNSTAKKATATNKILFPASALARKGAYEIRQLAKELNLSIVITGQKEESTNFWKDVDVKYAGNDPFDSISMIIYPAYVEHQPRFLLKALAAGIPVVATAACGLPEMENLTIVPTGDYEVLKKTTEQYLNNVRHEKYV